MAVFGLRRLSLRLCLAIFAFLVLPPALADDSGSERMLRVKAAFLLNIARFVYWPAEVFEGHEDRLLLCLYQTNPLGSAIDTIRGKPVANRRLDIARVQSVGETRTCNILFVPPGELEGFALENHVPLERPLLTVTDLSDGAAPAPRRDVLVTLVRDDTRIGFEIDLKGVRRAGLRVSSELLKLARIVGDGS